jgi:hypothetical protein
VLASRIGGWVVPWAALSHPATERPRNPAAFNARITLRIDRPDLVRALRFGRPRAAPARLPLEARQWDVHPHFLADAIDSGVTRSSG